VSILESRWRPLFRRAYRSARSIPAISSYTGARLAKRMPELSDRIHAIPLGVSPPPTRAMPPSQHRERAFLAVGAVKRRKGAHLIVEALARLSDKFPDAKLYVAGDMRDTKYVDEVKAKVTSLGLGGRVVWLGQIDDAELERYYDRVRGLVMPSLNHGLHFEGFGLVHLEANALGVPAIGSRECGNEDAIKDDYSGFLVEQNNVEHLSAAMARLLGPTDEWDRMSKNAVEFARAMSWDRTADAYAKLYAN
jgi:glycosyltransferase involved in cell wall biosynthesis